MIHQNSSEIIRFLFTVIFTILFWDFAEANVIDNSIETNDEKLYSKLSDVKQEFQDAEIEETELNLEREISKNLNARLANENDDVRTKVIFARLMLNYMASDFVEMTGLFAIQEATVVKSLVKFVLIRTNSALLT